MESETRHRPGSLKQPNKTHKSGRHRTKREVYNENRGRVNVKVASKKHAALEKQAQRRNQAKMQRQAQRDKFLEKKRQRAGHHYTPPHLLAVVSLSVTADCTAAVDLMTRCVKEMEGTVATSDQGVTHFSIPRFKQRMACFVPATDLNAILDAAKTADSLLLVTSADDVMDDMGEYCLKCLTEQGMPTPHVVCQGLDQIPQKKLADRKKAVSKEIEKRMGEVKVHPLDSEQDAVQLIRRLTEGKMKPVHYRDIRPYIMAESIRFEADSAEAEEGTLKVCGYLRGADLSANRLVHLVGWGTFQIAQIDSAPDPYPLVARKDKGKDKGSTDVEMGEDGVEVLARPDPARQVSLASEVEVDPMEDEQTWPSPQDIADAEESTKQKSKDKGYQDHWLFEDDKESDEDDSDDEDEEEEGDEEDMEAGSDDDSWVTEDEAEDSQSVTETGMDDDDKYDVHFDLEAEKRQLEQLREERENTLYPDEMDTPLDVPARERFARYRGLASFRTSPWPEDEEMPADYKRIFSIGDNKALKLLTKKVLRDDPVNAVAMGRYITVHVKAVPKAYMDNYVPHTPVTLFGLFPLEERMTTVHMAVKRSATYEDTVKSKSRLHFQMGFRRFHACPVFSEMTKGDKQKMERYLPHDDFVLMSVFAPITLGSCPVLVFRENSMGEERLLGSGRVVSLNPNVVILKRVVLSGHIFKTGKKKMVVRFMFFNREDIDWFKTIELRTKMGRRGRILEPLGTHGHMKCAFNLLPKSQDIILLKLYKRVYPKWTYQPDTPLPPPSQ